MSAPRAAVAFFIFNRPSLTERVFSAIARARPPVLLVIADGPRDGHPQDAQLVEQARAVIEQVNWPCQIMRCYSETNLGCKQRLASGLNWVFSQVPEAIILEDDTLPDQSFFAYCEELLERYHDDGRVHAISGFTVFEPGRFDGHSYYFSHCYHVWGWATWARAWACYDIEMAAWPQARDTSWPEQLLGDPTEARIARDIFELTYQGRITTWDFQWVFASWINGGVSITPEVNLVTNLGYGSLATNERNPNHPLAELPTFDIELPLRHPDDVSILAEADRAEWRLVYRSYFPAADPERPRRWLATLRNRGRPATPRP